MGKKWMVKLGTPILALAFIVGCGPTNNDNDVPQDTNVPKNENVNYENTRYNNGEKDIPDQNMNNDQDEGPSVKYYDHNLDLKNRR